MGVYAFVYNLQEEVHRFAIKASQGGKRKTLTHSSLEKIKGIGPSKARKLLSKMPLARIKNASVEELVTEANMSHRDAENIYEYYKNQKRR